MNIWVVWPTVHPQLSRDMAKKWKALGYKVAILVNPPHDREDLGADKVIVQQKWAGFPKAANALCRSVDADIVVAAGDDVHPDSTRIMQEVGAQFLERFPDLFGVMQPTGDDFANTSICAVSPWIGRTFIEKAYNGNGPFWEEYFHYYSDHELQVVAEILGAFHQRKDITQYHDHWQRRGEQRPPHLQKAQQMWKRDRMLFEERKKRNFPGHEVTGMTHLQQTNAWRNQYRAGPGELESVSGYGSYLENTKEIREALPGIFTAYDIKTFTDIPCGDWNWMKEVDLGGIEYRGYDIVPEMILANQAKYGKLEGITFGVRNIVEDSIPKSDLVMCRDLLFHLSNWWITKVLKNIKVSGSKLFLSTSFPNVKVNDPLEMGGSIGWRPINLCLPPFNLPKPIEFIQENNSHACRGRIVGLWNVRDL